MPAAVLRAVNLRVGCRACRSRHTIPGPVDTTHAKLAGWAGSHHLPVILGWDTTVNGATIGHVWLPRPWRLPR